MQYRIPTLSLLLPALLTLAGCNSSDATNDSANNNYTVLEGTVPGTLIEAFCEDGSYYFVHSTDNGTDAHPFSLTIPKNLDCHLVMTTNEDDNTTRVITPIRINTAEGNGSLFYGLSDTADLGNIPLAMQRSDINDTTNDGVSDELKDVPVVSGTLVTVTVATGNDPMDSDGDGIINLYEDDDGDGSFNREDSDDDGNGIDDIEESDGSDTNGNNCAAASAAAPPSGTAAPIDSDDDNDAIPDSEDND